MTQQLLGRPSIKERCNTSASAAVTMGGEQQLSGGVAMAAGTRATDCVGHTFGSCSSLCWFDTTLDVDYAVIIVRVGHATDDLSGHPK